MSTEESPVNGERTAPAKGGRRTLRHGRRAAVAAAAAAVLLAGGGTWSAMASSGDPESGPASAPTAPGKAPTEDDGKTSGDEGGSGQQLPAPGGAAGERGLTEAHTYSADGRTLKLTFWADVCSTYTASTVETDSSVQVRIRAEEPGEKKMCVRMAEKRTVETELEAPLDGRRVVDARTGEEVARAVGTYGK